MTKQFKFGDLVRRKADGITCFVVRASLQHIWVVFEGYTMAEFCKAEDFELIPHPDTVRLDWLADKNNNMGSVLLPTACVEKHLDSLRDAIDAAMKLHKVKDENNAKI